MSTIITKDTTGYVVITQSPSATTNAANLTSGTLDAARLPTSGVTAGSYTSANITVDNKGRVTAAANGSSGGGTWGSITGTLADQADLLAALNLKANSSSLATVATTGAYSDLSGTPSIPTGANPSATIGLTANNGSAATFLRSDATSALDVSIAPTWTGAHAFNSTITQTSNSATAFQSGPNGGTNPVFRLVNSTASSATGLSITGNAAGSGVTLTALSSGTNEDIRAVTKGTGLFQITPGAATSNILRINYSDGTPRINLGVFTTTSNHFAGAWFGNVTASTTNYAFIGDGLSETIFNAAAGSLRFRIANVGYLNIDATAMAQPAASVLGWTSTSTVTGTIDLTLRRAAAANLALGAADAASPVAQTLSVQNVSTGTSNTSGAAWNQNASRGTGTGAGGVINFNVAPASGSSGSTQNALSTVLCLGTSGTARAIGFFGAALATQQSVGAAATDAASTQTLVNNLRTALINLGLCTT